MGELQHTPGPWHVREARGKRGKLCFHEIVSPDGEIILSTWGDPHLANANLAAAAIEMLAALQASEREYENLEDDAPQDPGCIECTAGTVPNRLNTGLCAHHLRRAAIAKATSAASAQVEDTLIPVLRTEAPSVNRKGADHA